MLALRGLAGTIGAFSTNKLPLSIGEARNFRRPPS